MAQTRVYEGTLEEINTRFGKELSGLHLKVIAEVEPAAMNGMVKPFYEVATPEQWAHALRTWAASHDLNTPLLSDEAIDRNCIYEGRSE